MPIALIDPTDWLGRERPFASADQKRALVSGHPFLLLDGREGLGDEDDVGFLIQLCDEQLRAVGESFVRTWRPGPHRLRVLELVRTAVAEGDTAGPCQLRLIEASEPGRSAFQFIGPFRPADESPSAAAAPPAPVLDPAGDIDPDDIPF